jgi:hypothetical protein
VHRLRFHLSKSGNKRVVIFITSAVNSPDRFERGASQAEMKANRASGLDPPHSPAGPVHPALSTSCWDQTG